MHIMLVNHGPRFDWLLQWKDGQPEMGWSDYLAYLVPQLLSNRVPSTGEFWSLEASCWFRNIKEFWKAYSYCMHISLFWIQLWIYFLHRYNCVFNYEVERLRNAIRQWIHVLEPARKVSCLSGWVTGQRSRNFWRAMNFGSGGLPSNFGRLHHCSAAAG